MRRLAKGRRLPRLEGITRRLKRSKRLIINRRGDGVHSPYAFHLISRVIRNRRPYYCFAELREELRRHTRELARAERPRPIRSSRTLELIFRIAHEEQAQRVLLISGEQTMVPLYLVRTGYVEVLHQVEASGATALSGDYDLILLERLPSETTTLVELGALLSAYQSSPKRTTILINTRSHTAKRLATTLRLQTRPQLSLDLLDLELWVLDPRLTPCRYKAVY
mgnify:FL=1